MINSDKLARKIEKHYASHNADIKLTDCKVIGNRLIYSIKIKKGTKESLVFNRAGDVQAALGLPSFQPFKKDMYICLAVSDRPFTDNSLQKMLTSPAFPKRMWLPIALGYDVRGSMYFADLAKFPHSMYGGGTGSGKTAGLRSLIISIIAKQPVNNANLIIIDTGASGLDCFGSVPHLSYPIVKDKEIAVRVIQILNDKMKERINLPVEERRRLPSIICIVDEYIDLIKNIGDTGRVELASTIDNVLRKGRHAKIHMVFATQEPAKQGMFIKLNSIYARMAFTTSDFYNSRAILGERGAEKLPGNGAMLFKSPNQPKPIYLQGAYMSAEEIKRLISCVVSKHHDSSNKFEITEIDISQPSVQIAEDVSSKSSTGDNRKEFAEIILWTLSLENVSALQIREKFPMGNRSYEILDELCRMKIVTEKFANQPREVLPRCIEDLSDEVMGILTLNGYTQERIADIFAAKFF